MGHPVVAATDWATISALATAGGTLVLRDAVDEQAAITVDLLYGDHEGGQRTISRFVLIPRYDRQWVTSVSRHWNLDRADPR